MGQAAAARRASETSSRCDRLAVDDRIAPVVEADVLGQQLGAEPVAVAGDRVDAERSGAGHAATRRAAGSGIDGACTAVHAPARWWAISAAKALQRAGEEARTRRRDGGRRRGR